MPAASNAVRQHVDGPLDAVVDHLLELRAREAHGGVRLPDEYGNDGLGVEREGFLGFHALAAQRPERDARARVRERRGGQPRGDDDVTEHDVVEVGAAEVGDARRLAEEPDRPVVPPCAG